MKTQRGRLSAQGWAKGFWKEPARLRGRGRGRLPQARLALDQDTRQEFTGGSDRPLSPSLFYILQ